MINTIDFRRALKAALVGPSIKDVQWTKNGHDFNIKKVSIEKTSDGIIIDGKKGRHISHRKAFRPDDQIYFHCKVGNDGKVKDLDINIKSTTDVLKEWFDTAGDIISVIVALGQLASAAKADEGGIDFNTVDPTPSSISMLDGDWESDVDFMIANIITYAAMIHLPVLAKQEPKSDFSKRIITVNPVLIKQFSDKKVQISQG